MYKYCSHHCIRKPENISHAIIQGETKCKVQKILLEEWLSFLASYMNVCICIQTLCLGTWIVKRPQVQASHSYKSLYAIKCKPRIHIKDCTYIHEMTYICLSLSVNCINITSRIKILLKTSSDALKLWMYYQRQTKNKSKHKDA